MYGTGGAVSPLAARGGGAAVRRRSTNRHTPLCCSDAETNPSFSIGVVYRCLSYLIDIGIRWECSSRIVSLRCYCF